MQDEIVPTIRQFLLSITLVPHIIKKYPLPFIVLCFKTLLSVNAVLTSDFLNMVTDAMIVGGYHHGSFIAWIILYELTYSFWLALPIDHPSVAGSLGFWFYNPTPSIVLLVFLAKLPMIVADVFSGLLVYKIVLMGSNSHRAAYNTFRVWFYNPAVTLLAEMWGSIDIVATMFTLACIYYFMRNRLVLSSIALVMGTAFKTYPLLILPILLIMLYKREEGSRKNIGILIGTTVLPLAALIMYFTLATNGVFLLNITVGQADYWFFLGPGLYSLNMALDQAIAVTVVLCFLVLFVIYDHKTWGGRYREDLDGGNNAVSYVFMLFLALFAFSYWSPQFLLWILPFATIDYGLRKSSSKLLFSFILTAMLWSIIYHGFYYSSWGESVFFFPNLYPIMIQFSQWLYGLVGTEIIGETHLLIGLKSMFTGVCVLYLVARLIEAAFPTDNRLTRMKTSKKKATKEVNSHTMPLRKLSIK